ncbi:mitochondrial enolase superfamily member 1 [Grus japonensis]|uniref:Mitochondrial enolase superfamily member 1 n=1 Tax=Grus japonensis TaxID=30415 RepID=A0ABC9X412_GRUJA
MKFNKDECKVLHLGKHNPGVQRWLGSSSVEKDLGVLVDNKLSMSEQHAAAAKKANRMLGCINKGITNRDKEVIIPLSAFQATPAIPCSILVPAVQKSCGQAGDSPEEGHQDDQRTGKPAM